MITLRNILVATDFGEASDTALDYGRTLARTFGATLHVLHVVENVFVTHAGFGGENSMTLLDLMQKDVESAAESKLYERTIDDDRPALRTRSSLSRSVLPAEGIIDYASENHIDLIVMGTHGRHGFERLVMGSVAERVVRLAPCPVLTVHHPEREFVTADALVAAAVS